MFHIECQIYLLVKSFVCIFVAADRRYRRDSRFLHILLRSHTDKMKPNRKERGLMASNKSVSSLARGISARRCVLLERLAEPKSNGSTNWRITHLSRSQFIFIVCKKKKYEHKLMLMHYVAQQRVKSGR